MIDQNFLVNTLNKTTQDHIRQRDRIRLEKQPRYEMKSGLK